MKRVFHCALSVVAAFFCLSCVEQQPAGTGLAAQKIPVVMTAQLEEAESRVNMESTVFSWNEGDKVSLRWEGQTYSSNAESETLAAVQGGKTARFEGEFSVYKEDADLYAYYSTEGSFLSKSSIAFRKLVPAEQKGNLAALSENMLFYSWIKKADIAFNKTSDEISGMDVTTKMAPYFAVLKLNVPSSLGYTSLRMDASSAVAGHVQLQPQKTWGTFGSGGFAYRPTGTSLVQSTSIQISDNGNIIGDDIYIVILPDAYDDQVKNYYSSSTTLKFTLSGPSGEISFEKELKNKIYNGTLTDLGSVPVEAALKVQECCDVPAVVLDSVKVSGYIARGTEYYFITGTEGFDALADPTPSDARLTASGITIPVQNKSDRLYIKVLGKCEGCQDVYLKAILRNWKFDINYIAPKTLVTDYDGLTLTLTSNFNETLCTDARIGYLGVRKGNAEIIPQLSGSGWINANFFAGSFGTIFRILYGARQIYDIDMPAKVYYSDNDIMKSVRIDDLSKENSIICEWSYNIWLRNFIFLEQASYVPAQYGGDVSIEDFDGNINYN